MADYFFDSSALVKAYIAEAGTNWVRTILDGPQHRISISATAVRTALLAIQHDAVDFTLVSADTALNDAARLEGLQVADPNVH